MPTRFWQKHRFLTIAFPAMLLSVAIGGYVFAHATASADNSVANLTNQAPSVQVAKAEVVVHPPTGPTTPTPTVAKKSSTTVSSTIVPQTSSAAASAASTINNGGSSPRGQALYVDPALAQAGRPTQITGQAVADWFGDWTPDVKSSVDSVVAAASKANQLATLVAYNIPGRDCGSYSAGGAASSDAYKIWIRQFAAGIGNRTAIVILEPDALAQLTCTGVDQTTRLANLKDAVTVLTTQTKAFVYLDAGHPNWIAATTMASRLQQADVADARGFSLNVSNFETTANNVAYGSQISAQIGAKPFVIDTSRNGHGSNGDWCNPSGRALGAAPTTSVGGLVDAYLWIKTPGESDGTCNGGPAAGSWWSDYANQLVQNS